MRFSLTVGLVVCAATLVQCAPTAPVDAATLLKNGQAAQALNAEWKNLTAADPCTDSDRACVDNSISVCQNKTWNTTAGRCSQGQQCFAIPNVKAEGTSITCTSEKNALSLINSTGAKGDTAGAGAGAGSTTVPESQASVTTSPNDATSSASATVERITVTATVTVTPVTTPLPVTIRTISPSEASQLVSSILASHTHTHASALSTQVQETPIPTATTSQSVRTVSPGEASMELSSILAIGQVTASPAATPATITLVAALPSDAAAAIATVSATPAADSASGYGYGGY